MVSCLKKFFTRKILNVCNLRVDVNVLSGENFVRIIERVCMDHIWRNAETKGIYRQWKHKHYT